MEDIKKDMRGHARVTVKEDPVTGRVAGRVEGPPEAIKRFSDMYEGERRLQIEHGAEENAKRDHAAIAEKRRRKLHESGVKVVVASRWSRDFSDNFDQIRWRKA